MNHSKNFTLSSLRPGMAALAVLAGSIGLNQAQVVSFSFNGTIDYVSDSNSVLPTDIVVGTAYSGTLSYNRATVQDFFPADPDNGVYRFENASANDFTMSVTLGTHTLTWNPTPSLPSYIQAMRGSSSHLLDYGSREVNLDGAKPPGNLQDWSASVSLWDNSKTALSSDALPASAPVLSQFGNPIFQFTANNGGDNFTVSGPIDAITPVPEPASAGLCFAAGLLAFGIWRARRLS